jgi:hypothetical protein
VDPLTSIAIFGKTVLQNLKFQKNRCTNIELHWTTSLIYQSSLETLMNFSVSKTHSKLTDLTYSQSGSSLFRYTDSYFYFTCAETFSMITQLKNLLLQALCILIYSATFPVCFFLECNSSLFLIHILLLILKYLT